MNFERLMRASATYSSRATRPPSMVADAIASTTLWTKGRDGKSVLSLGTIESRWFRLTLGVEREQAFRYGTFPGWSTERFDSHAAKTHSTSSYHAGSYPTEVAAR